MVKLVAQRTTGTAKYFTEDLNGVALEMVLIPSGSFEMGAPEGELESDNDERPQHIVTVPQFFMGKYPVTQAQYEAIIGENPSNFKGDNRPVERVSWHDAVKFCEQLSQRTGRTYRLPSEAEWEYACRAGTKTAFHFGQTISPEFANYNGRRVYGDGFEGKDSQETTPVGSFGVANRFGLYDMHGNVWEWCEDHWHDNFEGAPEGGSAWTKGGDSSSRVLRGGSWYDVPQGCRSAYRFYSDPGSADNDCGFRVVSSASRTS
ncbi:MAG: formylglycine-generating enzyme family protein [Pegethrix bostrychoides GSE-TBD4-15B]|jgi:formylglycine-generating enzyme required for sulfatase activity|uniref:Formylglycine-generating enzyme family protein n=1 Tax=Pegethrix bostrychoides GSE-TBD4-15B TaxID=2839662 RepID=A0A951PB69_9CYAN|nr:formylglycine-generating enzyme family protein [Pegethrix bostrychoides GSE-TBD4-15B]